MHHYFILSIILLTSPVLYAQSLYMPRQVQQAAGEIAETLIAT